MKRILTLILLLNFYFAFSQEKKKTVLDKIADGLDEISKTMPHKTSQMDDGSYAVSTLRHEFKEEGAGGVYINEFSPRNHMYKLNLKENIVDLKINTTKNITLEISDEFGNTYNKNLLPKILKKGEYTFIVKADRGFTGKYEVNFSKNLKDLKFQEFKSEHLKDQYFDIEEGSGGEYYFGKISPRNQIYEFELNKNEYMDLNVISNGLDFNAMLISPTGSKIRCDGQVEKSFIYKSESSGIYQLYISTKNVNQNGKISIFTQGNLISFPKKVEVNKQKIVSKWTKTNVHQYIAELKPGNYEIQVKSPTTNVSLSLSDFAGNFINTHENENSPKKKSILFEVKEKGTYYLDVNQEKFDEHKYELCIWGNFFEIKRNEVAAIDLNFVPINENNYFDTYNFNLEITNLNTKSKTEYDLKNLNSNSKQIKLTKKNNYELELKGKEIFSETQQIDLTDTLINSKKVKIKYTNFDHDSKLNFIPSYFKSNSSEFTDLAKFEVDKLISKLIELEKVKLKIDLFSFESKDVKVNSNLNNSRKQKLHNYLVKNGIENNRISINGKSKIGTGSVPNEIIIFSQKY